MDIEKMIKEIADEVMKTIGSDSAASAPASRGSAFDAPIRRAPGCGSAYDLGPCVSDMRRETGFKKCEIGRTSAFDNNFGSRASHADFDFTNRGFARVRASAFDYQTRL